MCTCPDLSSSPVKTTKDSASPDHSGQSGGQVSVTLNCIRENSNGILPGVVVVVVVVVLVVVVVVLVVLVEPGF